MQIVLIESDTKRPRNSAKRTSAVVLVRLGWPFFLFLCFVFFLSAGQQENTYREFPKEVSFKLILES